MTSSGSNCFLLKYIFMADKSLLYLMDSCNLFIQQIFSEFQIRLSHISRIWEPSSEQQPKNEFPSLKVYTNGGDRQ